MPTSPSPFNPDHVLRLPGLISFWDFQEPTGAPRVAKGPGAYALRDEGVPVTRADEGVFGPHSAEFHPGSWLRLPRAECPALDLHGPQAQVSVVAWIKRSRQQPEWCDCLAGLWDEGTFHRQYALFLACGLSDVEPHRQVIGHVSATGGGALTRFSYCDVAASGATPIPYEEWVTVAMSYDGHFIRAYLQGRLDDCGPRNPYAHAKGIHDGGSEGSDFTVGANHLPATAPGPRVDAARDIGCGFNGLIGGLAVFDRALEDDEMASLRLHHETG